MNKQQAQHQADDLAALLGDGWVAKVTRDTFFEKEEKWIAFAERTLKPPHPPIELVMWPPDGNLAFWVSARLVWAVPTPGEGDSTISFDMNASHEDPQSAIAEIHERLDMLAARIKRALTPKPKLP